MKLNSFPGMVKFLLKDLPTKESTVYGNYFTNYAGTQVDLSTFSPANRTRDPQIFMRLYHKLWRYIEQAYPEKKLVLCPFDATVTSLMSKLQSFQRFWGMGELSIHRWKGFELYPVINKKTVFWRQGYRQVK